MSPNLGQETISSFSSHVDESPMTQTSTPTTHSGPHPCALSPLSASDRFPSHLPTARESSSAELRLPSPIEQVPIPSTPVYQHSPAPPTAHPEQPDYIINNQTIQGQAKKLSCKFGCVNRSFDSKRDQTRHHMSGQHRVEYMKRQQSPRNGTFIPEDYQCGCGHTSSRSDNYIRHIKTCRRPAVYDYRCGTCGDSRDTLEEHVQHINDECQRRKRRKITLKEEA